MSQCIPERSPARLKALLSAMVDRMNGIHARLCSWESMPLGGSYSGVFKLWRVPYRILANGTRPIDFASDLHSH